MELSTNPENFARSAQHTLSWGDYIPKFSKIYSFFGVILPPCIHRGEIWHRTWLPSFTSPSGAKNWKFDLWVN